MPCPISELDASWAGSAPERWQRSAVTPISSLPERRLRPDSLIQHAGLAGALSRLIERAGDDERRAPGNALPVVDRLARDLTGRRS